MPVYSPTHELSIIRLLKPVQQALESAGQAADHYNNLAMHIQLFTIYRYLILLEILMILVSPADGFFWSINPDALPQTPITKSGRDSLDGLENAAKLHSDPSPERTEKPRNYYDIPRDTAESRRQSEGDMRYWSSIYQPTDDHCECNCNDFRQRPSGDSPCEWTMLFKAVAGNGRCVRSDFLTPTYLYGNIHEAQEILCELPYRHPYLIDDWVDHYMSQVKVEVYDQGDRKAWFLFDGTGTNRHNWFTAERLIASSYTNIKTENFDYFQFFKEWRTFLILPDSGSCSDDCGYLEVVEPPRDSMCPWQTEASPPFFFYSEALDSCGEWGSGFQRNIGDRLAVYAKVCTVGW